jgi:hypothetical protein
MKNFFDFFFDFITGGIFNYLGAIIRLPFSKEKFSVLAEESLSNSIGMFVSAIILFLVFAYIYLSV